MKIQSIQFDDSLGQLFDYVSEMWKMCNSVLCMASLGLDNCSYPPSHTFNQPLTHLWLYVISHLCYPLPNLPNPFSWYFMLA